MFIDKMALINFLHDSENKFVHETHQIQGKILGASELKEMLINGDFDFKRRPHAPVSVEPVEPEVNIEPQKIVTSNEL